MSSQSSSSNSSATPSAWRRTTRHTETTSRPGSGRATVTFHVVEAEVLAVIDGRRRRFRNAHRLRLDAGGIPPGLAEQRMPRHQGRTHDHRLAPARIHRARHLQAHRLRGRLVVGGVTATVEKPQQVQMGLQVLRSRGDCSQAGIEFRIPVDAVIDTKGEIGRSMDVRYRETAGGGLAATPTGRRLTKERLVQLKKV